MLKYIFEGIKTPRFGTNPLRKDQLTALIFNFLGFFLVGGGGGGRVLLPSRVSADSSFSLPVIIKTISQDYFQHILHLRKRTEEPPSIIWGLDVFLIKNLIVILLPLLNSASSQN